MSPVEVIACVLGGQFYDPEAYFESQLIIDSFVDDIQKVQDVKDLFLDLPVESR